MNYDLKIIKKKYGEKFSHLCRDLFPTLLEKEGMLSKIILDNFDENHYLYDDIVGKGLEIKFSNFIYSLIKSDIEDNSNDNFIKSPLELMNDAGYVLFECKSEDDIQQFRKYYAKNEELCTFNGNRLDRCHVFFAVKKNVDEINRFNFIKPDRQDLYGTSVISIQFTKDSSHTLSIKNRYNHTVNNPDATFSNNLDNIIEGLTDSFARYYGLIQKNSINNFEIPGYVRAKDGRFYKFNYELHNVYYCYNNIIIDNFKVREIDKSRYLLIDYFIVDKVDKRIFLYDNRIKDCFVDLLSNIKSIDIKNSSNSKVINILSDDNKAFKIVVDKFNRIIELDSDDIIEIKDNFLESNRYLKSLKLANLESIGNNFLYNNLNVKELRFDKLKSIGNNFMYFNHVLLSLVVPNLKKIGDFGIYNSVYLENLVIDSLEEIGYAFAYYNRSMVSVVAPNLKVIGSAFMFRNQIIESFIAPKLRLVGDNFLSDNSELENLSLESLEVVGDNFLNNNIILESLYMPKLEEVGYNFLSCNDMLEELNMENLRIVGYGFITLNKCLKNVFLPNLFQVDDGFLFCNKELEELFLPSLKSVGSNFMYSNNCLKKLTVDNLEEVDDNFLINNLKLRCLIAPKLRCVGDYFLVKNLKLSHIVLPSLNEIGYNFLNYHFNRNLIIRKINGCSTFLDDVVCKIKKRSLHIDAGGRFRGD